MVLKQLLITKHLGGFKSSIKLLHIFNDFNGYNMLFVTNDNKVYGFGSNQYGCCGLGHNRVVNEPQLIPELSDQNIIKFFTGPTFVLAQSSDNKIFV